MTTHNVIPCVSCTSGWDDALSVCSCNACYRSVYMSVPPERLLMRGCITVSPIYLWSGKAVLKGCIITSQWGERT